ncbi:MAG: antibiotic biosynthesis monooxygenase, partial [Actinomycetes bacterium]
MTIARSVAPGREGEFEDWSAALTRAASRWPGFLGAGLLRPGHVGEPWHVVFRFASAADLAAWESSPERAEILAAGEPLVHATDMHRVSGLETWFALPGRTAPAPPRWKMFLVTLLAIVPLVLLMNLAVLPLLGSWPLIGRTLVF